MARPVRRVRLVRLVRRVSARRVRLACKALLVHRGQPARPVYKVRPEAMVIPAQLGRRERPGRKAQPDLADRLDLPGLMAIRELRDQ